MPTDPNDLMKTAPFLAHLAFGGVLFYGVSKFFDTVEGKLADDTRLEIAVWLLGVKAARKVQSWPQTFATMFDRLFGRKHLTWYCFNRSCMFSFLSALCSWAIVLAFTIGSPTRTMFR